jgi:hypothetical protein
MIVRIFAAWVAALGIVLLLNAEARAADPEAHEGVVVKAGDGKLTMSDKNGTNERTHQVAADAKISLDGKECRLDELRKGTPVKVTVEVKGERKVATRIEARNEK